MVDIFDLKGKNEKTVQILLLLLLIPHFEPVYFDACVPIVDKIYNVGRVISALYAFGYFLKKIRSVNRVFVCFALIQVWYLLNTIIQNGVSKQIILNTASMIVGGLIVSSFVKDYPRQLINALLVIFEVLIIINFICLIVFPKGMYATEWQWENWFLGFRNVFTFIFIPAIGISMIWKEMTGKNIRLILLIIVCLVSSLLGKSATCLVTVVLISFLYFSGLYKLGIFNSVNVTILYLLGFVSLVCLRVTNYLEPLMSFLGRSITLTGRTFIWDRTINAIMYSPFFGYGQQPIEYRVALVPEAYGATSAHDFILEHLYTGGLVQLVLVIVFFAILISELKYCKQYKVAHCMTITLLCIYLLFIVESSFYLQIYIFLLICGNAGIICEQIKKPTV